MTKSRRNEERENEENIVGGMGEENEGEDL